LSPRTTSPPDGSTWQSGLTTATVRNGHTMMVLTHPVLARHSQKDGVARLCAITSAADGGTPAWHSSDDALDGVRSYSISCLARPIHRRKLQMPVDNAALVAREHRAHSGSACRVVRASRRTYRDVRTISFVCTSGPACSRID